MYSSYIRMSGKILGVHLFLDEVVTQYQPPYRKTWKTTGDLNLLVIGHYQMGVNIVNENKQSRFTVFIDYELPSSIKIRWLGYVFGKIYAKWCVRQLLNDAKKYYTS